MTLTVAKLQRAKRVLLQDADGVEFAIVGAVEQGIVRSVDGRLYADLRIVAIFEWLARWSLWSNNPFR